MTEAVKHITYRDPVLGNNADNPLYTGDSNAVVKGGGSVTMVSDQAVMQLLGEILVELKKINLRQEVAFEEPIHDGDVTCG